MRGRFWLAETPRMCVDGTLDLEERTVALEEELVSCMVVTKQTPTVLERSPLMDTSVRYLLHGLLEDGTEVTVPNANRGGCSHSKHGVVQSFLFLMHLSGGHVSSAETYDGAVVTFGAPWPAWLSTASWSAQILMPKAGEVTLSLKQGTLTFQARAVPSRLGALCTRPLPLPTDAGRRPRGTARVARPAVSFSGPGGDAPSSVQSSAAAALRACD